MAKPIVDFSRFKKTVDNDQEAVMTHPDGHRIHLAKQGLSPDILKQLKALPLNQAEPEEAVQEQAPVSATEDSQANLQAQGILPPQPAGPFGVVNDATGPAITDAIRAKEAQDQSAPGNQPPAPDAAPVDPNAVINAMPGGAEELAGNKANTAALTKQADTEAGLAHAHAVQEEATYQQVKRDLADKQTEIDAATEDIRKGHINPNHYLESKSTVGRVATAIGLLLGGISSGQTGQANPAMVFLNKQIENDLEAQKANLSNKHTLLSALHQQYGDRVVADNMFRAIRANTLAAQVAEAGAKSASGQAKAASLIFTGQLKKQATEYRQLAGLNQLKASLGGANGSDLDSKAQAYLQVARVKDPKGAEEFEKRYIPNVGVASVPIDDKDRSKIADKTELADLLNQASDYMTKHKGFGAIPGTADHAEGAALQGRIKLIQGKFSDLSRYTPEEAKTYTILTPDLTGTHFTGQDLAKTKQLQGYNNNSLNTFYKQKGIGRSAGDTDMVKVIGPDGRSGSIPKANLARALKANYRQVQ